MALARAQIPLPLRPATALPPLKKMRPKTAEEAVRGLLTTYTALALGNRGNNEEVERHVRVSVSSRLLFELLAKQNLVPPRLPTPSSQTRSIDPEIRVGGTIILTEDEKRSVSKINKQLDKVANPGGHFIFRVPGSLKKLEPDAFVPHVVSIGPYHKYNSRVKDMENQKWRLLKHVLSRQGKVGLQLESLVQAMFQLEEETRNSYDQDFKNIKKPEFVEMMLLDGCFILELLKFISRSGPGCSGSGSSSDQWVWFNLPGFLPFIQRDLLMLENQLPLLVLVQLFCKLQAQDQDQATESVAKLALEFFDSLIPGISENLPEKTEENTDKGSRPFHLLDLVRVSLQPSQVSKQDSEKCCCVCSGQCLALSLCPVIPITCAMSSLSCHQVVNVDHMPSDPLRIGLGSPLEYTLSRPLDRSINCRDEQDTIWKRRISRGDPDPLRIGVHSVTKLRGTGINFEVNKGSKKFTDIRYENGKLLIPCLHINGSTKSIFLNLMAFEQCCPYRCTSHITSYISFMDELINSPKDVEYLNEKQIIVHALGSEKKVADLFNNLRQEIHFDPKDSYLSEISKQLNIHDQQIWFSWMATLKQEYLKDPWKVISIIAAGFLIILTALQTVFTILAYRPSS